MQKLGIAITTVNRREMLLKMIAELRNLTARNFELVICDDGSSDGTCETLKAGGEVVIGGTNKGVAWNKNRGIYYLMVLKSCDIVILLDDDIHPIKLGWEEEWVQGTNKFGHLNFAFPDMVAAAPFESCVSDNPCLTPNLGGPCISFSRYAWSFVGYMDSRFKQFGHEHTEFSNRFLLSGFGGIIREFSTKHLNYYFVIQGGLEILSAETNGSTYFIQENQKIWEEISLDARIFRLPWHDPHQQFEFMNEVEDYCKAYDLPIAKSFGLFRDEKYLEKNNDVKLSSFQPWYHFENFGIKEEREIS